MVKMSKIYVVFWTQGGNTQAMAQAVGEGITAAGKEAEVIYVGGIKAEDLKEEAVFAMGCPAMGAEVLEEDEFQPMFDSVKASLCSGKEDRSFRLLWLGRRPVDERLGRPDERSRSYSGRRRGRDLPGNAG